MTDAAPAVSVVIPVFNKIAFTRQCLDRLARHRASGPRFEVIIVDNGSTDATEAFFHEPPDLGFPLHYVRSPDNIGFSAGNNLGARRSGARDLLFLNNDTLVTDGWLAAMMAVAGRDSRVGIVGIKQLFPYTNQIHHTGIIFAADKRPRHIYAHADASLPYVNKEREYQAVTGSCLLIPRDLFEACGGFDEAYRNGYEDIDLCLRVRQTGRTVVCCTSGFIYHYGQISETRTADDASNAERLATRWASSIKADEHEYYRQDRREIDAAAGRQPASVGADNPDVIYFADDLSTGSALNWVTADLVAALARGGAAVALRESDLSRSIGAAQRRALTPLMRRASPVGGVQVRWSHYWPQYLEQDLHGRLNLELFVINYQFAAPDADPWDYWLQCVRQNHYRKLPLSAFSRDVLLEVGVPAEACGVLRPGYAPEILRVDPPPRRGRAVRFLTVTNSHDLERYGTRHLLDAYWSTFTRRDDVTLVVKDYGAGARDTTLRDLLAAHANDAATEYVTTFTSKEALIELYRSCDAFVSAHRGEGYGMKVLDAMACGLPVVAPLFGGVTEFCAPDTCLPVDFSLVPVGDCLDTRSLHIANRPVWAEPSVPSLAGRLRQVADDREAARRMGEAAQSHVLTQFTWDEAARSLLRFIRAQDPGTGARRASPRDAPQTEASRYWLGCRISVIVPTFNRSQMLLKCLRALERQSILPQEFEVVVVDDGSTDDTREVVASQSVAFRLRYVHQANAGPGAARNAGLTQATGELVLFIGDDIMADERLLEAHLTAHATAPSSTAGTAMLGHIDWSPELRRSAVMDFVTGPAALQFAYDLIPTLPTLDFRFFYTSNISLKRQFLVDAAADGVTFDPCFTTAAFEDAEFALRLLPRGLRIQYAADARVHHEHWMDLDSFSRREHDAGRMAVIFYRKHPGLDDLLQVRWIGDWTNAVNTLLGRPDLLARLQALETRTGAFLGALAATLDERYVASPAPSRSHLFDAVLTVVFDVARTRGKVEEWYGDVTDPRKRAVAVQLIGCARRLAFLASTPEDAQQLSSTIAWLDADAFGAMELRMSALEENFDRGLGRADRSDPDSVTRLQSGIAALEHQLTPSNRAGARRRVLSLLRRADLSIQYRLSRHLNGRLLRQYGYVRHRLKQLLPGRSEPR